MRAVPSLQRGTSSGAACWEDGSQDQQLSHSQRRAYKLGEGEKKCWVLQRL